MTANLVIIGCGGFGREVADVVDAINLVRPTWKLLGFVDDSPSFDNLDRLERRGASLLGGLNELAKVEPHHFVVGIGASRVRRRVETAANGMGWRPATLVHPTAALGANLHLGAGSVVCAYVAVGSDVTIGQHVHLDRAVQVGHDSKLGDFVTAHPAAVVSGNCDIGSDVELGTNCTLLPGVAVRERAVIGAAACVTTNIPPDSVVKGVPAR